MADTFDHKMAYDRAEIDRLKKDIHEDDLAKHAAAGSSSKMLGSNSPAKNQNKGYADSRELTDMPLTKDMTGGRHGSWMSKHSQQSRFGSPLHNDEAAIKETINKTQMQKGDARDVANQLHENHPDFLKKNEVNWNNAGDIEFHAKPKTTGGRA